MRIFAAADLHGTQYRLNLILQHIEQYSPDVVVICGDITEFGPAEVATNFLDQIPVETFAVRGNCDPLEVNNGIEKSNAINLRMKIEKRYEQKFIGLEFIGAVHSPEIENETKVFLTENVDKTSVLVSHVPPHSILDSNHVGKHLGNKFIYELVNQKKPRLVICGHVHENPGFKQFESTMVVNCSIGKKTEGAVIDLDDEIKVEIIS